MSRDDPYHDNKIYHMAHLIREDGAVSPLCADKPRKINLKRELWTIRKEAATCEKCLDRLQQKEDAKKLAPDQI